MLPVLLLIAYPVPVPVLVIRCFLPSGMIFFPPPETRRIFYIYLSYRDAPETHFALYPANLKAGYRISDRISGASLLSYRVPVPYHNNRFINCSVLKIG
jgi:hypothetical protein